MTEGQSRHSKLQFKDVEEMLEGGYSKSTRMMNGIGVDRCKRDMNILEILQ